MTSTRKIIRKGRSISPPQTVKCLFQWACVEQEKGRSEKKKLRLTTTCYMTDRSARSAKLLTPTWGRRPNPNPCWPHRFPFQAPVEPRGPRPGRLPATVRPPGQTCPPPGGRPGSTGSRRAALPTVLRRSPFPSETARTRPHKNDGLKNESCIDFAVCFSRSIRCTTNITW